MWRGASSWDGARGGSACVEARGARWEGGRVFCQPRKELAGRRSFAGVGGNKVSASVGTPRRTPDHRSSAFHRHYAHAALGPRPKQLSHRFLTDPTLTPFQDQPSELWGVTGLAMGIFALYDPNSYSLPT